jgi:hypothetical protein
VILLQMETIIRRFQQWRQGKIDEAQGIQGKEDDVDRQIADDIRDYWWDDIRWNGDGRKDPNIKQKQRNDDWDDALPDDIVIQWPIFRGFEEREQIAEEARRCQDAAIDDTSIMADIERRDRIADAAEYIWEDAAVRLARRCRDERTRRRARDFIDKFRREVQEEGDIMTDTDWDFAGRMAGICAIREEIGEIRREHDEELHAIGPQSREDEIDKRLNAICRRYPIAEKRLFALINSLRDDIVEGGLEDDYIDRRIARLIVLGLRLRTVIVVVGMLGIGLLVLLMLQLRRRLMGRRLMRKRLMGRRLIRKRLMMILILLVLGMLRFRLLVLLML